MAASQQLLLAGGGDPFFPNVSLLLHGNGTNGSTSIIDSSSTAKTPTLFGNTQISTAQSKFGGASIRFDGTGDNMLYAYSSDIHLPSDFTIETFIYPVAASGFILAHGGGPLIAYSSWEIIWGSGGTGLVFAGSSANASYDIGSETVGGVSTIGNPTLNTWSHIAVTRSGNSIRGFLNGALNFTLTTALVPYDPATRGLVVGGTFTTSWGTGTPTQSTNAYLDEVRITKGIARYTAAFTPPAAQFPNA